MNIGNDIRITRAKNPQLIGVHGRIIDETKHTLIIMTAHGKKTIIKEHIEETQ